jgi:NitT/TauT family transport system substrate-binding protein
MLAAPERTALKRRTALPLLAAGTLCTMPRPAGAETATLRVGMALTDGVTPLLYANQTGIFKEAGIDVQLVAGNSGAALAAALTGGTLDIAASSLMPVITAYTRGVPLRIIAGSSIYSPAAPTSEICVARTARITSFADLSGATVAMVAVRSLDQLGIQALVDKSGGNSATLKFLETPGTLLLGALEHGRADAASISEPNLAVALESGEIRTLGDPYAGIANGVMIAAFFCTPAFVAGNRSLVDRFTSALYRATAYTNTHHAETVSLLAEYAHMDPEIVRKMTRLTNATSLDLRMIQPAIDAAAKYKYIDTRFSAKELLA